MGLLGLIGLSIEYKAANRGLDISSPIISIDFLSRYPHNPCRMTNGVERGRERERERERETKDTCFLHGLF